MDPVSAAGLAIGVASIGFQVYTGCIQGIQLILTAKNLPEDCKYLNLRLRMEQQRLFAWSETSGLLDFENGKGQEKILESSTFVLHRTTVLDLLVQIQCLFKEFQDQQKRYKRLQTAEDPGADDSLENPEKDASEAHSPLPPRRRDFLKKAMANLKATSKDAGLRLRWASFDKQGFEQLLSRFNSLNDSMTDILDARLQAEIHNTVQDTNRGMLQLHRKITDLSRLVMALNLKMDSGPRPQDRPLSGVQKQARQQEASGLRVLSEIAKFKAFNAANESGRQGPLDETTAVCLDLGKPGSEKDLKLDASRIRIKQDEEDDEAQRCEAIYLDEDGQQKKVWIEWKEYDRQLPSDLQPPKQIIMERVKKLAALLHHSPKPEAFKTPHCLGYFDKAESSGDDSDDDDISNLKLGLVFERPGASHAEGSAPPESLRQLLERDPDTYRKPSITDRVKLAHAIANCLLCLHLANWLHKSLRSDNVIFFRDAQGRIDYSQPYLSGFDFSRPSKREEMTEAAADDVEYNLYRHPSVLSTDSTERERFKKSFDIYSLGVLFVEIAHWGTIEDVLRINLNEARGRPSLIARVREKLLTPQVHQELGANMGDVFAEAASKCIAGSTKLGLEENADETNDEVAAKLSMAFYEDVVKRLETVVI